MRRRYDPTPIDVSGVALPAELEGLVEALARNTHDTWAVQRLADGWSWGPERNDSRKEHPCLVPYEELPESEKQYDRATAVGTIKLVLFLGFELRAPRS